ncbi:unnamed protein product [Albugo candida]|uniref:Mediator of RNA polymerase II transcription subunit 17 n=2 Tax=Albugo candida TaxID=65357 RepID=A0A024G6V2_9STRA|nr:unnamed protein product [Albugo candida]|eukprot:CCI42045.1 unnamed protein product [Albugo candida]
MWIMCTTLLSIMDATSASLHASPVDSEHMEQNAVKIALYPHNYRTVEMIDIDGTEIFETDIDKNEIYLHELYKLKEMNAKEYKKSSGKRQRAIMEVQSDLNDNELSAFGDEAAKPETGNDDIQDDNDEQLIDPRVYYQSIVKELQAAVVETTQLINTIDLIRKREFLEEVYCMRENTAMKVDEMDYLIKAKSLQLDECSHILMHGANSLDETIGKEGIFFQEILHLLQRWKLCAPTHGNIPKPFRAGEPIAPSNLVAGSKFVPQKQKIEDLAFAELRRTKMGLVQIQLPEEFIFRTLRIELDDGENRAGYTLPAPAKKELMTKADYETLKNCEQDIRRQQEWNTRALQAVRFSFFCEEAFASVMQETLQDGVNWTGCLSTDVNTLSQENETSAQKARVSSNISVQHVFEDEVKLRLTERFFLTLRLIDIDEAKDDASSIETNDKIESKISQERNCFLRNMCRSSMILLQELVRQQHGRRIIFRGICDGETGTVTDPVISEKKVLSEILGVLEHALMKEEIATYLDELSAALNMTHDSSKGRTVNQGYTPPICDSIRGVSVYPCWKACPHDATLSALDLKIGKNFDSGKVLFGFQQGIERLTVEILLRGTQIQVEDGTSIQRVRSEMESFKKLVETLILKQLASELYRDVTSFGVKHTKLELDGRSVRIILAGEWDGNCIGEGRVADDQFTNAIYLEPYFLDRRHLDIRCLLRGMQLRFNDVESDMEAISAPTSHLQSVEWAAIPGRSDTQKVLRLLQAADVLSPVFRGD